jgi:hypothetical protein|tara:strand:+ start:181 stop:384 length:204 start_codon:yes stop_codon:yes gene_type:complete
MKIKEYVLRIIIDEESGDELLHLSERYDCEQAKPRFRLEVKGIMIETPEDLQDSLDELEITNVLGVA